MSILARTTLYPGHEITFTREIVELPSDDGIFKEHEPTGRAWGRCACGWNAAGKSGQALNEDTVKREIDQHWRENSLPEIDQVDA